MNAGAPSASRAIGLDWAKFVSRDLSLSFRDSDTRQTPVPTPADGFTQSRLLVQRRWATSAHQAAGCGDKGLPECPGRRRPWEPITHQYPKPELWSWCDYSSPTPLHLT
jgi:hypothetical protein